MLVILLLILLALAIGGLGLVIKGAFFLVIIAGIIFLLGVILALSRRRS
jgi:hypothetical protein